MKATKELQEGKGPFELVEEAFHLLRLAPAGTLAAYYLGSLPLVLGALFFWSDMSRSAFAQGRLGAEALTLSLLFCWMKTWQSVFAQNLLAQLAGEPAPVLTWRRWLRTVQIQGTLQPSALLLMPLALLTMLPFGWTFALYQNLTALGTGEDAGLRPLLGRAWRQARLWPMQNHNVLFLLQPFALFVFLNLISGVIALPWLFSLLFGVDTTFTRSMSALLNTTFFAAICGLTYLCLDPLVKAIYVLRCFYGESLRTGRDLRAELRGFQMAARRAGVVAVLLAAVALGMNLACATGGRVPPRDLRLGASSATDRLRNVFSAPIGRWNSVEISAKRVAHPSLHVRTLFAAASPPRPSPEAPDGRLSPTLSPPELDRSIDEVLRKREFTWRMPREKRVDKAEERKGVIATFIEGIVETLKGAFKAIGQWLREFVQWLGKYLRGRSAGGGGGGSAWMSTFYLLLIVVAVVLVVALVLLLIRLWQGWHDSTPAVAAQAIASTPDLGDENIGADQLPGDGWLQLARELMEKGELRFALRAFYLASLAHLAQSNLLTIAKFKSNLDYQRELQRRAHALPEVWRTFEENVGTFDRVWYGLHEVTSELLAHFAANVDKLKSP